MFFVVNKPIYMAYLFWPGKTGVFHCVTGVWVRVRPWMMTHFGVWRNTVVELSSRWRKKPGHVIAAWAALWLANGSGAVWRPWRPPDWKKLFLNVCYFLKNYFLVKRFLNLGFFKKFIKINKCITVAYWSLTILRLI